MSHRVQLGLQPTNMFINDYTVNIHFGQSISLANEISKKAETRSSQVDNKMRFSNGFALSDQQSKSQTHST